MHRNGFINGQAAFVAAVLLAWSLSHLCAQTAGETRPAAIDVMVAVPATGEQVQLVGTAAVDASVAAQDGVRYRMPYTCDVAGDGRTATPGNDYHLIGHASGTAIFDGPLPATVSATCPADLTRSSAQQRYDIAVEVSVLADGAVGSAAVRQVVPAR